MSGKGRVLAMTALAVSVTVFGSLLAAQARDIIIGKPKKIPDKHGSLAPAKEGAPVGADGEKTP